MHANEALGAHRLWMGRSLNDSVGKDEERLVDGLLHVAAAAVVGMDEEAVAGEVFDVETDIVM